jgi:hypothetical protein
MKKNQRLSMMIGQSTRGFSAALVAGALLTMLVINGAAWAQEPAATPGVASATEQTAAANEVDPKAIDALKKMSAYLRTLKSYTVHSEATKDEVLESGQNIQFSNTVDIYAKLPNRLRVDVNSDRKQRRIYYDGKTVTQYAPRINYYASVAAPGTIRETLKVAADKYDLDVPLADLFFWGTDQSGIEDINSAIDVGPSRIGGVECDHFAFRQEGADWQIWIERGKAPLPRKLVITTMDEPSQPQYSSLLRWDLKASLEDKIFTFVPPKGAQRIEMAPVASAN